MLSHLEASGVVVTNSELFAEIENTDAVMAALAEYENFLELTLYQVEANIRNSRVTDDGTGQPYQRKYIEWNDDREGESRGWREAESERTS